MYRYSNGEEFFTVTREMRRIHTVKDYTFFEKDGYISTNLKNTSEPNGTYRLGDVVSKTYLNEDGEKIVKIGVIIQTYRNYGSYRTDMYGDSYINEDMPATISEIREFRPELLEHLR